MNCRSEPSGQDIMIRGQNHAHHRFIDIDMLDLDIGDLDPQASV